MIDYLLSSPLKMGIENNLLIFKIAVVGYRYVRKKSIIKIVQIIKLAPGVDHTK
jgi:hypothetical protein